LRYVSARFNKEVKEEAYRIFISDAVGALIGAQVRYYDIVNPPKGEQDPDEIVNRIQKGLGEI
jgi:hypothetical protein